MITNVRLKRLRDQVIVITGASSGIGMATAKRAARTGAAVVLTGRDEKALQQIAAEIRDLGGQAQYVVADASDFEATKRVADFTLTKFGRFDTWVNNAGVHIYGTIDRTPVSDARRLFDVNYWGVVHGCRAAASFLKHHGGAIINVGSALSDRSVPLQGYYGASKHAVQGYTDSLRMELEAQAAPVSVTLIKPAVIDTPLPRHARNYMEVENKLPPPYYAPEVVARTVLACAESYHRDVIVGGVGGVGLIWMEKLMPRLSDRLLRRVGFTLQRTEGEPSKAEDSLYQPPPHEGEVSGGYPGYVARTSLFTSAYLHPAKTVLFTAGAVATAAAAHRLSEQAQKSPK